MKRLIRLVLRYVPRKYIQRIVQWCTPLMGLLYAGRRVECPICGRHYRKFMPYGYVHSRENALCPHCLALERHRLLWLYLQNETDFFEAPARLLHIAPEYCFIKRFERLPKLDYVTADLESPLAKVKMDIQQIPFPDNEFDIIFCNHIRRTKYCKNLLLGGLSFDNLRFDNTKCKITFLYVFFTSPISIAATAW